MRRFFSFRIRDYLYELIQSVNHELKWDQVGTRGSTASNKEYYIFFPILDTSKYSLLQLYTHETDLILGMLKVLTHESFFFRITFLDP